MKKCSTGQEYIRKDMTSYKIHILIVTKSFLMQTSLAMAALDLKEKLELVLDPSSQDDSIA